METRSPNLKLEILNQRLRRQLYDLHSLFEITLELNSLLDEEKILSCYLYNIFGLLSNKSIAIVLNSRLNSTEFTTIRFRGLHKKQSKALKLKNPNPVLDLLKKNKGVLVLSDVKYGNEIPYLETVSRVGGILIAPLMHAQNLFGMVILGEKHNKKSYSQQELEIFSLLTNFLAASINNARLYQEMERLSLTDALTGLYNRRYFETYLENELARARRFNQPVSLVMLDIDNFKNYNDTLGHPAGDDLLRQLGQLLSATVRTTDIAARYGGEEFCVILPHVSWEGAASFCTRLQKEVFSYPFEAREVQPNGRVTVSIGTATYPYDAQCMEALIAKSDLALYEAKKRGRNQVMTYAQIKLKANN